jgi:hypothetical protein
MKTIAFSLSTTPRLLISPFSMSNVTLAFDFQPYLPPSSTYNLSLLWMPIILPVQLSTAAAVQCLNYLVTLTSLPSWMLASMRLPSKVLK